MFVCFYIYLFSYQIVRTVTGRKLAVLTPQTRRAKPQDIVLNCLLTKLLASDLFINANNQLRLIIQINY